MSKGRPKSVDDLVLRQFPIKSEQDKWLDEQSARQKKSRAEIVRQALDDYIALVAQQPSPPQTLAGIFAHLNVNLTEEEFMQARREIWQNFPRDIQ